ncbi:hypothetical protein L9F63_012023, partial [Diploptera punctata]
YFKIINSVALQLRCASTSDEHVQVTPVKAMQKMTAAFVPKTYSGINFGLRAMRFRDLRRPECSIQ